MSNNWNRTNWKERKKSEGWQHINFFVPAEIAEQIKKLVAAQKPFYLTRNIKK